MLIAIISVAVVAAIAAYLLKADPFKTKTPTNTAVGGGDKDDGGPSSTTKPN
jgi:hypothetical protein